MALEGSAIEFSIANTSDTRKTFYWTLEAVKGTPRSSDFDQPPFNLFTGIWPGNYNASVTLNPGESQSIPLKLKSDNLIEGQEIFNIASKSDRYSEDKNIITTISIQDKENPRITISPDPTGKLLEDLNLETAPGENKNYTRDDFQFAIKEQQTSDGDTFTINPIKRIISLSPSSFILQYKEGYGTSERNRLVLATKNKQKNPKKSISYQELPKFSTHRYSYTINATLDSKGNLYSIHSYYPSGGTEERKTLLLKHNQKGKEVFQVPLSSHDSKPGIATDNKNGLLISSSNHSNVTVQRRSSKTGKQLWSSQPFFGVDGGGFNKSSRSLQPLDDGSFLVAASGFLDLYGHEIASYIAKVSLKDGNLQTLLGVDGDASYWSNEFFTQDNKIFFRTGISAYSVSVDAKPTQTLNLPGKGQNKISSKNKSEHKLTKPKQFRKQFIDKITNFNPRKNTLTVSRNDFDIEKRIKFAIGKNKRAARALSNQELDFIYDQKKGGLYYNENGAERGFGDGGLIAILKGAPDISAEHIQSI